MQVEDYDKLLKQVYRTAPIGLCLFDTELRYRYVNEWLAEINGLSVERHLGRSISEVLPNVAAGVEAQLRRVIETGEPVVGGTVEVETAAEPGVKKHFEHHYHAARTPDGAIVGVSCVVQDVTERKKAEESLRQQVAESNRLREQLATSEALHRTILEAAPQIIWQGEADGAVSYINRAWVDITGMPKEKALGSGWATAVHPDDAEELLAKWERAYAHGKSYSGECRFRSKDGSYRTFDFVGVPVRDTSGEIIRWVGIDTDITERKRAEEALVQARDQLEERVQARTAELAQSELRHRVLLESTNAVPWEADATTWQFTYVGPQAIKLLGYPPQQWLEANFWPSHIHPEDREFAIDYCLRSAKSEADFDFEYRMITADGRTVWIHDIVNVESEAGEPKTLRGFMIDITARKQAEEALRVSATRLQLATDAARIGHWDWDIRTNEVYFSREWKRQLGYEDHEIPNLFEEWESRLHPDDLQQTIKNVEDYVAGRKADHVAEFRLRHKDGSYRWIYTRAEKQVDETGKACRLFGCHIDITDRKRAEEKLRKNRDDMQVLVRRLITAHEDERRRLARELHDDLSQRLASIAIDSSMLESAIRPVTESGADKLAKLSDRIRATSVDVHQVSRQLHPSILDELGLVKALQAECNAFQRRSGIALRFERPSEYSSVAKSTELALYRIMQECLRNIEKHSRAVSACVTLHVNEAEISLTVTDTGTGFDPTQQREEPGLGLASLKERAGLLGGTVSIQSEIGRGTTVTAHLPAKTRES